MSGEYALRPIGFVESPLTDLAAAPMFATVLDGRNEHVTDGVVRALDREPRDFTDYARETAATGVWAGARARRELIGQAPGGRT